MKGAEYRALVDFFHPKPSSVSVQWCTFGRTAGRTARPEWICSLGFYFEFRAGGEVRISGFYNNKQANKQSLLVVGPTLPSRAGPAAHSYIKK